MLCLYISEGISLILLYNFITVIVYVSFILFTRPHKLHSLNTHRVKIKVLLTYLLTYLVPTRELVSNPRKDLSFCRFRHTLHFIESVLFNLHLIAVGLCWLVKNPVIIILYENNVSGREGGGGGGGVGGRRKFCRELWTYIAYFFHIEARINELCSFS